MRFNSSLIDVQDPPIAEVKSWLQKRTCPSKKPLIDCCQAMPNYPPAQQLTEFLSERVKDASVSRYTVDEGILEVRQSVCSWYERRYGTAPSAEQVCMTVGASQAFWLAILSTCRTGDEVIIASPAYFDHAMALRALGIRMVWVPYEDLGNGKVNVKDFADRISAKTRALLLVTPSNPTGLVFAPETLRDFFDLANRHNLALILDETYNAFVPYESTPHNLFNIPNWHMTLIHLASFGKTFALTGYRAGALIASPELVRHALKIQDTMAVCQPHLTQLAVQFACNCLDDWLDEKVSMMAQRHQRFREIWDQSNLSFECVSSGSFFAWVRHPWKSLDSRSAAQRVLDEADLICLPGEAFGPGLKSYLRLAFGNLTTEQVPEAVDRFKYLSNR
ncbi:MAG: aminotransferase [Deltaproteobacteria bacterium]|jgi:aspartate/methionine/tyrosine aminotransferase|nr:aminotransferase [Deltaproteobacteria bacterium]